MTAALVHRGPDEEGFLVSDPRAPGLAALDRPLFPDENRRPFLLVAGKK